MKTKVHGYHTADLQLCFSHVQKAGFLTTGLKCFCTVLPAKANFRLGSPIRLIRVFSVCLKKALLVSPSNSQGTPIRLCEYPGWICSKAPWSSYLLLYGSLTQNKSCFILPTHWFCYLTLQLEVHVVNDIYRQ